MPGAPSATSSPGDAEFGVFVVWSRADDLRPTVLAMISDRFEIRAVHRIRWSPELVAENFARLYRTSRLVPPFHTYFERQKGHDTFTVVGVLDHQPTYAQRMTRHGEADVNIRLFDLKAQLRELTAHELVIHASDTAAEGSWDVHMLLGLSATDYVRRHSLPWDGSILEEERDLIGARGWRSLTDLFQALNSLVPYVVMRNYEQLPDAPGSSLHDDIDLLVGEYANAIRVLNARPLYGRLQRSGGRFRVDVAGSPITVDIRYPGDGYFDERWQRAVLERRRLTPGGVSIPSERDYFETLAYHAMVHKPRLSDEYRARLMAMSRALGEAWSEEELRSPQSARRLLDALVVGCGREYVRPADPTVFFNFSFVGWRGAMVRRKVAGLRRRVAVRWWPVAEWGRKSVAQARQYLVRRVPVLRHLQRPPRLT